MRKLASTCVLAPSALDDPVAVVRLAERRRDVDRTLPVWVRHCLGLLREPVRCPVWMLPGNHDLWARRKDGVPSRRLWEQVLPETVEGAGCYWLEGTAFVRDGATQVNENVLARYLGFLAKQQSQIKSLRLALARVTSEVNLRDDKLDLWVREAFGQEQLVSEAA